MSKKFSLKAIETQMLTIIIQQHQALISNFLSFIALERLSETVTEKTVFEISPDLKEISISEPEEKPEETETAKAMKGKK